MRVSAQCFATVILGAAFLPVSFAAQAPAPAPAGKGDATAVLAAARQALGGEKKLTAVKTLTAVGRTRQVRGDNLVPIEFEIFIELPDKYVRKDEIPAQESGPNASGFNADALVQDPPPVMPPIPPGAPPDAANAAQQRMSAARVTTLKQDFTRLTLGLFASSFASYPLTFTYVAEAEAPQGKADVLEGKGPNNFTVRFFISRDTHLPIMVSWTAPAGRGMPPGRGAPGAGGAPGAPAAPGAPGARGARGAEGAPSAAAPAPPTPPENRIYFADYRDVDGMQFPFRLRRAVGADTIEETTFDRFKVNGKIDPKRFEVRK